MIAVLFSNAVELPSRNRGFTMSIEHFRLYRAYEDLTRLDFGALGVSLRQRMRSATMQKPPPYILDETVPRTGGQNFSSPGQGMGKVRMGPHDRPLAFISFNDLLAMCTCRVRLELLVSLSQRPMAVSDLARRRQLAVAHVSQYLRRLAAASLVEFSQQGPGRVYSVSQRFSASPSAKGLLLAIAGDDGSEVSILLPWKQAERLGYEQAPSVSWSPIRRIVSQEPLED